MKITAGKITVKEINAKKKFYIRYQFANHRHSHLLRDDSGIPVKNITAARIAAEKILEPLRIRHTERRATVLANDAKSIKERISKLEKKLNGEDGTTQNFWRIYAKIRYPMFIDVVPPHDDRAYITYRYCVDFMNWCNTNKIENIGEINAKLCEQYFAALQCGNSSYNDRCKTLKRIFEVISRKNNLGGGEKIFANIEYRKSPKSKKKPLSINEVQRLINEEKNANYALLFAIGYFTGLRLGDAVKLHWSEIDLNKNIIRHIQGKVEAKIGEDRATVIVPLNPQLKEKLNTIKNKSGDVLPELAAQYRRNKKIINNYIRSAFNRIGAENTRKRDNGRVIIEYGFHSLRHSFVSHYIEAGVPAAIVQSMVGHASPEMTNHYTKISAATKTKYIDTLKI